MPTSSLEDGPLGEILVHPRLISSEEAILCVHESAPLITIAVGH